MHARTRAWWTALVGALAIVAACSSGGDDVADPTAETFETVAPTEPLFTPNSDDGGATAPTDVQPATDVPSATDGLIQIGD